MATPVYIDTSVFIAVLGGNEATGPAIKELLRELKRDKVKIYTSIITVQEVSVLSFLRGSMVTDNHSKVAKLARIAGITKEIALTAAKYEAQAREIAKQSGDSSADENRRRKWDCFHMATAIALNCRTFYTLDKQFAAKRKQLNLQSKLEVIEPRSKRPALIPDLHDRPSIRTGPAH